MRIVSKASPERRESERIRYECGFACIRCGCTVYEYCQLERIVPPEELFLMCLACQDQLNSTGEAMAPVLDVLRRRPLPRQPNFDREGLPYVKGHEIPDVEFAFGATMRQTAMPILLANKPVLSLFPPEAYGGPARMTITLGDADGAPQVVVDANLWTPPGPGWRFERLGNRYRIESPDLGARLELAFLPGSVVRIEQLRCRLGARSLAIDANGAQINGESVAIPNSAEKLVGVQLA